MQQKDYQLASNTCKITNALMFRVGKMKLPEIKSHPLEREISGDCGLKESRQLCFHLFYSDYLAGIKSLLYVL